MSILLLPAFVLVVVIVGLAIYRINGEPAVAEDDLSRTARRRTQTFLVVGVVAGLVAAIVVGNWIALGRGLLLAGPVFALVLLSVVIIGELTAPAPSGGLRTVTVGVRRVHDYVPRRLGVAVAVAAAALVALAALTTAGGSADDMGRSGRSLSVVCSPTRSASHGPWPGSFYTVPLAIVAGIGVLAAVLALGQIARRPRFGGSVALEAADETLRHRAGAAVTAACGLLVAVPLLGVSVTAATALQVMPCGPQWWEWASWALLVVVASAAALIGWCLVTLLLPRVRSAPVPAA